MTSPSRRRLSPALALAVAFAALHAPTAVQAADRLTTSDQVAALPAPATQAPARNDARAKPDPSPLFDLTMNDGIERHRQERDTGLRLNDNVQLHGVHRLEISFDKLF